MLSFGFFRCCYRLAISLFYICMLHSYWVHPMVRAKLRKKRGMSEYSLALDVIDTLCKWDAYKDLMHIAFLINLIIFGKSVLEYTMTLLPYDINSVQSALLSIVYGICLIGMVVIFCQPLIYSNYRNFICRTKIFT